MEKPEADPQSPEISLEDFYVNQHKPEFISKIRQFDTFVIKQNLMLNLMQKNNEIRIDLSALSDSNNSVKPQE